VASIVGVHDELAGYGDELANWISARRHSGWFLDVDDEAMDRKSCTGFHGSHAKEKALSACGTKGLNFNTCYY